MAINSLGGASRGLSGLVSGMDTQQMVESMLAGTQNKIDAANQKKSQLTYKQQMYRDVSAKLRAFQGSFFSFSGGGANNLLSTSFYNSMSAASTSSAFKATANNNAPAGKSVVNYVRQLAKNLKLKSGADGTTATGKVAGKLDAQKIKDMTDNLADAKNNLKIQAGTDAAIEVSLKDLAGKSSFEIEAILQGKLSGSDISVAFKDGQFQFLEANGKELSISGTADAMAVVGLGRTSGLYGANGVINTALNGKNLLPVIGVTLDGVHKSIYIDPFEVLNAAIGATPAEKLQNQSENLKNQLNAGLRSAFGAGASADILADGRIEFKTSDISSKLTVGGGADQKSGLDFLGIANNTSTKISTTMSLANANFQTRVVGDTQRFSINGVDFSVSSKAELGTVISTINSSDAGVKISYSDVEDRFILESTVTGKLGADLDPDNPFRLEQKEGNFLTALFGAQPGSSATGKNLTYESIATGSSFAAGTTFDMKDKSIELTVGDMSYMIYPDEKADGTFTYTLDELAENVNKKLAALTKNKNVQFSVETDAGGNQSLKVESKNGAAVTLTKGLTEFGIADDTIIGTKVAKADTALGALGLDGTSIDLIFKDPATGLDRNMTVDLTGVTDIQGLTDRLNTTIQAAVTAAGGVGSSAGASFDEKTGAYRIFGVEIPMRFEIGGDDGKLFGLSDFTLGSDGTNKPNTSVMQQGQNAIISINGVEVERSGNEFTVGDIGYELKDVNIQQKKNAAGDLLYLDADGNETTTPTDRIAGKDNAEAIVVSRDTDKIVTGLKKFVEEYNKLVNSINELTGEDPTYRDYPPLTTKQKENMSDKEIEKWEEKAKGGLMRNDSTLEGVMSSLRSTLYTRPDGGKRALYDLGITTAYQTFEKRDNLVINDENELKQKLAENPEEVMKLFMDNEKGLARLMNTAIERAISTSSDPKKIGSLVQQAGAVGVTSKDSFLGREISNLDQRITTLKRTYESEYDRYWAQFNNMEKMISQMNQQSSWLTQQTGG